MNEEYIKEMGDEFWSIVYDSTKGTETGKFSHPNEFIEQIIKDVKESIKEHHIKDSSYFPDEKNHLLAYKEDIERDIDNTKVKSHE